mmetsp:Transcript_37726/g.95523  ORF Transcript_37726/g.95523 Transcript_37726/m.95523 type:complete len:296 (-) Transcript_37726:5-892(-)
MKESGVEENRVALGQGHLHAALAKILLEFLPPPRQVAQLVLMGVRQVDCGAGLDRHVAMGDSALQCQQRRHMRVHVRGILLGDAVRREAEVVIPMHGLGLAPRPHHVGLGGDLVVRPEPSPRCQRDDRVRVVVHEGLRAVHSQLLQRVPDARVRARLGKVVAPTSASFLLLLDDRVECRSDRIHILKLRRKGTADADDPWTLAEGARPLFSERISLLRGEQPRGGVVDQDTRSDLISQREVTQTGLLLHGRLKRLEAAIAFLEPARSAPLLRIQAIHVWNGRLGTRGRLDLNSCL